MIGYYGLNVVLKLIVANLIHIWRTLLFTITNQNTFFVYPYLRFQRHQSMFGHTENINISAPDNSISNIFQPTPWFSHPRKSIKTTRTINLFNFSRYRECLWNSGFLLYNYMYIKAWHVPTLPGWVEVWNFAQWFITLRSNR